MGRRDCARRCFPRRIGTGVFSPRAVRGHREGCLPSQCSKRPTRGFRRHSPSQRVRERRRDAGVLATGSVLRVHVPQGNRRGAQPHTRAVRAEAADIVMGLRRGRLRVRGRRSRLDRRRLPQRGGDPAVLRLRAVARHPDGRVVGKAEAGGTEGQAGLLRDGSVGLDGDDRANPLVEAAYSRFFVPQPVQQRHVHWPVLRADRVPHGTLRRRTGASSSGWRPR